MTRITSIATTFLCLTLLYALTASVSIAQNTTASASACADEKYRQFDFWLGKWKVTTPDGKLAGYNTISQSLNGCVINEHYTTPTGYEGNSFNIYDKQTGKWHQTWVDNTGLLLKLDGNMISGAMSLLGTGKSPDGSEVMHRITWTPYENGTVSQSWQTSKDNGDNWTQVFLGLYTKIDQ